MANRKRTFSNRISSANVLSDGMLSEISYGDYALMMVAKDKPDEPVDNKYKNKH